MDPILKIFQDRGHEAYFGEAVSQYEHAAQSAELARQARPHDYEFQLAAFLHDVGHLCPEPGASAMAGGLGTVRHEAVGAAWLAQHGFPEKVVRLVQGHVEAKRYLVAADPAYYAGLSEASRQTLDQQGGPMREGEQLVFERDPYFELHILLRRIDDQAKATDQPTPDVSWLFQRGFTI